MAVRNILGVILILLVADTKAYSICYHISSTYGTIEYTGYCYMGCCGSQCCESTTETPELDDNAVAAIVVGCVLGFALLVAIIVIIGLCCYYKHNTRNRIMTGHVLTAPQPLFYQGTYPSAPPSHLPPTSHGRPLGVSFRPSYGHLYSEMTQFPNGQRNDPLGYHPELEMTQYNHGHQSDPPRYEHSTDTSNGNTPSAPLPDLRY